MNIALWIVQGLLAIIYLGAGGRKVVRPIASLSKSMPFVRDVPPWLTRCIGMTEMLGAIGVLLPLATGILPWLTIAAAAGLGIVQALAIGYHVSHGDDPKQLPLNVVLLLLALFVVIGRVVWVPVA